MAVPSSPGDLLTAADVFVLPNLQTYFDLMLLEVLSAGKMVIAARTGGNRYFEGLSDGLVLYNTEIELAAALRAAKALSPEEREARGAANKALYEARFTPRAFARNYVDTLEAISADYPANPHRARKKIAVKRPAKVSVIVPVYNVEPYLEACLASIAAQSLKEIEVLVVNDGATDGSPEIIDQFVKKDPRFRRLDRPNGGLSAARNTGLDAATGTYIAFADSDDQMAPDMLARMFAACEEQGTRLAVCGVQHIDADGAPGAAVTSFIEDQCVYPKWQNGMIESSVETLSAIFPSAWNKLYHRSLFDDVRYDHGLYYEDHPVFYKIFLSQPSFAYVNAPLYQHRDSGDARITKDGSRRVLDVSTVLDILESIFRSRVTRGELRLTMARLILRLVWERLWTADDQRTRFRLAEQAVMRFAAHELTQEEISRQRDAGIDKSFVAELFEIAESGEWTNPSKVNAPLSARISVRDATPRPLKRPHKMVGLDAEVGFLLVHPQLERTTTAEILGLGFFGPGELSFALSVEHQASADVSFRVRAAPASVFEESQLLGDESPIWLADTGWITLSAYQQKSHCVTIP